MRRLPFGLALALLVAMPGLARAQQALTVGIGIQNTTSNTVTGGVVIEKLGLLDKYLPHDGKYKDLKISFDWQTFTSGPPVTNGMIADKLQIGMMGDYPLLVNGATFQAKPDSHSLLVAVIAYNANGAGNGLVVNKDSPYYQLGDLKGKLVSVPFGSAAHGMVLKAMQDRGWGEDFWQLVNQSPEIGATNLQENKIDAHADFVPFAELLPFRGYARKIFDGAETKVPTFHGVVVRQDFADKYPEIVVAYLKALIEANAWFRADPKQASEKIEEWTKIEKEVVYIFLGPGGIMTLDPTLKPKWNETIKYDTTVLQKLGRVKEFDVDKWFDDRFIRQAFKDLKLDYDAQLARFDNYAVTGSDAVCNQPVTDPKLAGEIWVDGAGLSSYSSPACTLAAIGQLQAQGKKLRVAYTVDQAMGIKLFADKAYYAIGPATGGAPAIEPFLLKADAETAAAKLGGRAASYDDALKAAAR
jgi:NitT/TauT family transport system substrate-binding protein